MKRKLLLFLMALVVGTYSYGQLSENFDGTTFPPDGWSTTAGSGAWDQSNQVADHTTGADKFARYDCYLISGGTPAYLTTPKLDVTSADKTFAFWANYYLVEGAYGSAAELYVDVSDDNGVSWTSGTTNYIAGQEGAGWLQTTIDLSNYEGQNFVGSVVLIRFKAISDYGSYDIGIDDVTGPAIYVPACPPPSNQVEANITQTSADLDWTETGSATIWNIEYGSTGFTQGSGTMITGTSTKPYSLTGLTAGTVYDWYVQADCGSGSTSDWTGPHSFETTPGPHSIPLTEDFENGFTYFNNAPGNTVDFTDETTLFHGGAHSVHDAYTPSNTDILHETGILDLSATSTPVLDFWQIAKTEGGYDKCYVEISTDGGSTYTALPDTSYQGAGTGYATAGYFDEDDYSTWGTGSEIPDNTWWKKETFDLSAYNTTNVRIRFRLTSDGSVQRDGWYIDDIHIYEPSCFDPTAQTESNITTSGADLGWTDASGSHWDIYVIPTGDPAPKQSTTPTANDVTTNPYTWSGGTSNTTYDWYVRSDCDQDNIGTSAWVGPSTFSTACSVQSTPYSEDFENGGSFPNCWTQSTSDNFDWSAHSGATTSSSTGPSSAHGGTYYIYTESSSPQSNGDSAVVYSPTIDLSALSSPLLNFWYHMYGAGMDPDGYINVSISTDGGSSYTSIWIKKGNQGDQWNNQTVDLSSYSGNVIFKVCGKISSSGTSYENDFAIDDFSVEEAPTCIAPTAQTEDTITSTSVYLGWTTGGSNQWQIEWDTAGFTQGTGNFVITTDNPYLLFGLTDSTRYDWYVRDICGAGDTSAWTGPHTFTTEVMPNSIATFPYYESFETGLGQWKQMNVDDFDWTRLSGATPSSSTGPSSAYSGNYYIYTEATGNSPDKTAGLLLGFDFSTLTTPQITFGYHMYGASMGTLQFEASADNGATWDTVWSQSGDKGNQWNAGTIMLTGYGGNNNVWLKIWGKTGSDYFSDMAVDSIDIREAPSCPAPTTQTVTNIGVNQADLGWTENGSATNWEIMIDTANFDTAGYAHTAVTANPYSSSGLGASTSYDWYVRSVCGAGDTSHWVGANTFTTSNGLATGPYPADGATGVLVSSDTLAWSPVIGATKYVLNIGTTSGGSDILSDYGTTDTAYLPGSNWDYSTQYFWTVNTVYNGTNDTVTGTEWSFTTQCDAAALPYFQAFDEVTAPAFPGCMTVENTNGDAYTWETNTTNHSAPNSAKIRWNGSAAMDDWFFTRGLNLTGGVTYEVNFMYRAQSSTYPEKLAVDWGNAAASTAMSGTPIFDNTNIINTTWATGSATFAPSTSGTYYVGFHGHSDANMYDLFVDDIQVVQYQLNTNWDGTTDSDWQNSGNWSNGIPPGSMTNVTIPAGKTNYPTLTKTGYCKNLIIQSDATGDGSLIGAGNLIISGADTIQRYLTGGQWHDVAAMTSGATVNAFYFNHNPDVWMNTYNEADNTRTPVIDLVTLMPLGQGFEAWVDAGNDATASFTGTINSGDVATTLAFSGPDPLGYNLVGNPFSSAISWDSIYMHGSPANIDDQVWVYDGSGYRDFVSGTGAGSLTNGIIPMGQGFFVHSNAASPALTIPTSAQVHNSQSFYKSTNGTPPHFVLDAFKGDKQDAVWILFHEGSTEAYENGFDGRKMIAKREGAAPQIYTKEGEEFFSIDCLPPVDDKGRTIPLYFKVNENGEQMIVAKDLDLVPGLKVTLEDTRLNVLQNLNKLPVYKFDAVTYQNPARFLLHLERGPDGINNQNSQQAVRAFAYDKYIYVASSKKLANSKKQVTVYDMVGREVVNKMLPPGDLVKIPVKADNAYLVVRVISNGEVYTTKVFIK